MSLKTNLSLMLVWLFGGIWAYNGTIGLGFLEGGFICVFCGAGLVGLYLADSIGGALLDLLLAFFGAVAGALVAVALQAYPFWIVAMSLGCLVTVGRRSTFTSPALILCQLLFALVAGVVAYPPLPVDVQHPWVWLHYLAVVAILILGPPLLLGINRIPQTPKRFTPGGP